MGTRHLSVNVHTRSSSARLRHGKKRQPYFTSLLQLNTVLARSRLQRDDYVMFDRAVLSQEKIIVGRVW